MIAASGVAYSYGRLMALDGVSLEIRSGELCGIIGPNGSGKSTLLSCLAGILSPREGRVSFEGSDLSSLSARQRARAVALVFQDNFFPFDFSALDVVLMGRSPYLGPLQDEGAQDMAAAEEAMRACDCWQFKGRSVRSLSGGERQRVVLARALAQEPRVLLMDEPANHLDLGHQSQILGHIAGLCRQRSLAAAAVFHDLNLASQFCGRLLLMDRGRLVLEGEPARVLRPEVIREVYRSRVALLEDPATGKPLIVHSMLKQ